MRMMLLLLPLLFAPSLCVAEIIFMKDGRRIECDAIGRTGAMVTAEKLGGVVRFPVEDVDLKKTFPSSSRKEKRTAAKRKGGASVEVVEIDPGYQTRQEQFEQEYNSQLDRQYAPERRKARAKERRERLKREAQRLYPGETP